MSFAKGIIEIGIKKKNENGSPIDIDMVKDHSLKYPMTKIELVNLKKLKVFHDDYWQQNNELKEGIINDIEDSFKKVKEVIEGNTLDFLKGINSYKIISNEIKKHGEIKYIEQIPVYLVNNRLQGQETSDGKIIPNDFTYVPFYDWADFKNRKNDIYNDGIEKNRIPFKYRDAKIKLKGTILLGLYQKDREEISSFEDLESTRRIFLWIDNIYETSKALGCEFKSIFVFILIHELMHALMDIYGNEKCNDDTSLYFSYYKEESLANGLALYLCHKIGDRIIISESEKFVKSQSEAYSIGIKYKSKAILQIAVDNWMYTKKNGIHNNVKEKWLDTFSHNPKISNKEVIEAEKEIKKNI